MNQRERTLALAVAALVVLWGGWKLYGSFHGTLGVRNKQVSDAEASLAEATSNLKKAREAVRKVQVAEDRSLPADRDKARTLYENWLYSKAKAAGLNVDTIKPSVQTTNSPAFKAIGYHIEAKGTLSSVVGMLYEFYHSPQLQQITQLRLERKPGSAQLGVILDVEALCLKGAIATEKLPEGDLKRLKLASAAAYQKSLGERDLATVYTPPKPPAPTEIKRDPPPPPPAPPKFDEAELAYFTGFIESEEGPEAWINVRSSGVTLHLAEGDPIKVGALDGTIESIEPRSLVYKAGDKKYLVELGKSLRSGKELDANGDVKETPKEPPKS